MESSTNDVGLLSSIIPAIPCSFPWKIHSDYKQLREMSDAWVVARFANVPAANERSASFTVENMLNSAFHLLVALTNPTGINERMPPIIKLTNWLFLIDNLLDDPNEMGADPTQTDEMVESVLTVFQGSYVHPSPSPSVLVRIFTDTAAEWWVEMCMGMPPAQKTRLSKALQDYMEAHRHQAAYRNTRHLPDLDTYLQIRSDSSGWFPCAVLIEHSIGIELDEEALNHPLLVTLHQNVVGHIFLVNDLTSFKKEYMEGDFCNVVSVLYFWKLFDPTASRPTLQESVSECWCMIKEKDEECVRLMGEIKNCDELMEKPGMADYLEGLGLWMSGSVYWHLVSGRYGICAVTDLHVQPPDLLSPHNLHIVPTNEAQHFVPCAILKP